MNKTIHIDKKDVPAILLRAFPGYNGRKFKIEVCEEVTLRGCAWDGGSKNEYAAVNLDTGKVSHNTVEFGNMFTTRETSATVTLPENGVVVKHSWFCGKDMGLTFYVRPSRVARMLPAPVELTTNECIVLNATAGLKSSYAGISNYRFHEARRWTGITLEAWDAAKASCIQKKLLNKAGAITVKGTNAVEGSGHGYGRLTDLRAEGV